MTATGELAAMRPVDAEAASDAELTELMRGSGARVRAAAHVLALASAEAKNRALGLMAEKIRARRDSILAGNAVDLGAAKATGLSEAMIDRLLLDDARIEAIARGIEEVRELPDPVGRTLTEWTRPNGLRIARVSVPLGVIGIIYESRPNVTADVAALCLKSGNGAILRGGSESAHSSRAIHAAMIEGIAEAGLPADAIWLVPVQDRRAVGIMLRDMSDLIDVVVPRGGKSLVARVQADARVPVISHLEGNNHVYVDAEADLEMAKRIVLNAKMRRTGVCGAAETLLVDRARADDALPALVSMLIDAGCEVRGDAATRAADARVKPASEADWATEYLDAVIAVRLVDGIEDAIRHVETYGSHHTDAIVTEDAAAAERFLSAVDSAIVLHNASTQFADGGEFGMGAEIGIATGRVHARGPVGAAELTSYKYVVRGSGQTRP